MMKPKFFNVLIYIFVKYIIFFTFLAFKESRFRELVINNSANDFDLFINFLYYAVYVLAHIIFFTIVLTFPMYFSLKLKNLNYFFSIILAILTGEYLIYTWSASPTDLMNGIYNGMISIVFFLLFFFRHISLLHRDSTL